MTASELKVLLDRFPTLRIGVLGDFCLDAYWLLDESEPERSVETGKATHAVRAQRYSLGGAGNVVNNVTAIGAGRVAAFGVIGDDLFGREMLRLLQGGAVDTAGMVVQREGWDTPVYAKPYLELDEQERIDFGRRNALAPAAADALVDALARALPELDGLIVNQQLRRGIHGEKVIAGLQALLDRHPDKVFVLDARDVFDRYRGAILKINACEAARMCGETREVGQAIGVEELAGYARRIHALTGRAVIVTRSDRGMLGFDGEAVCEVPGILSTGELDPVGAGDTAAAAIVCTLAAGAPLADAMAVGNYAAAVVVRKLRQTGTAAPAELAALAAECDYVFRPEAAEDIRKARYAPGSELEVVNAAALGRPIRHAIFDHDGTLSVLRQGWERIMEPVMVRAILGDRYDDAPEELYHRIVGRVRDYIDQSTGVETIVQMEALVRMVRQFGQVPAEGVLDARGYKEIYNRALMDMVSRRIAKLERGELRPADFTIASAPEFLRALRASGVRLYLASGTDHADVAREAQILGYAGGFEGRIYGWAGTDAVSAKRRVMEQIVRENGLSGEGLACFGDGPVELRLCKRCGGLAVGVASDEVRRYGLNPAKRTRLIKAGADLIVPDFSQHERLLDTLVAG